MAQIPITIKKIKKNILLPDSVCKNILRMKVRYNIANSVKICLTLSNIHNRMTLIRLINITVYMQISAVSNIVYLIRT